MLLYFINYYNSDQKSSTQLHIKYQKLKDESRHGTNQRIRSNQSDAISRIWCNGGLFQFWCASLVSVIR